MSGVNKFQIKETVNPFPFKINDSIRQIQFDKLNLLKKLRDEKAVVSCLQKIRLVAKSDENLMPVVIDAVENYCTLGEIADSLREVYGEFK